MTEIKPVPIEKKDELINLINQLIEERKSSILDKLEENNFKEPIVSKIRISTIKDEFSNIEKFVCAFPIPENPVWLIDFLKPICVESCNQLFI